jgi:hypothetical protein
MSADQDTLPAGMSRAEAGTEIVFDFKRQAWFPDGAQIDKNRTARATLTSRRAVRSEDRHPQQRRRVRNHGAV